jgi:hypothetical protein
MLRGRQAIDKKQGKVPRLVSSDEKKEKKNGKRKKEEGPLKNPATPVAPVSDSAPAGRADPARHVVTALRAADGHPAGPTTAVIRPFPEAVVSAAHKDVHYTVQLLFSFFLSPYRR